MGLLKGSVPVVRFRVIADSDGSDAKRAKVYRVHAFVPIDPDDELEKTSGWVDQEGRYDDIHLKDADVDNAQVLRIRMDVLKPPTSEVKRVLAERVRDKERDEGRLLARREKKALKEEVTRELRQRAFPRVRYVEALLDRKAKSAKIFATSKGAIEEACDLLGKTFDVGFDAEGPESWASEFLVRTLAASKPEMPQEAVREAVTAALQALPPEPVLLAGFRLTPELSAAVEEGRMVEGCGFLGREFLTWLLFRVSTAGSRFEAGEIGFGERCKLGSAIRGDVAEVTMKGGAPAESTDVLLAIANGMTVEEIDLVIFTGAEPRRRFEATVGEWFQIKKSKLPSILSVKEGAGFQELAAERLALLDELDGVLRYGFEEFLRTRLSLVRWREETVPAMRAWLVESLRGVGELSLEALLEGMEEKKAAEG